jgi:hypothetical protein
MDMDVPRKAALSPVSGWDRSMSPSLTPTLPELLLIEPSQSPEAALGHRRI